MVVERAPQLLHETDERGVGDERRRPQPLVQLAFLHDAGRGFDEHGQELERLRREVNFAAAAAQLVPRRVELERTEARANADFVETRARLFSESGATWIEVGGTYAMFDGVDSPITQTFGLGTFEDATDGHLDKIESFFQERGAAVCHEVSPMADLTLLGLLGGIAFALFYATFGIPIAAWADRSSRRNVLALAALTWSTMTALCGLATTFWWLLLARIGTAIGEAGGTPPSHSLI